MTIMKRADSGPAPPIDTLNPKWKSHNFITRPITSPESVFRQDPSPIVGEAWDRVSDLGVIPLTAKQVLKLGKDPDTVVKAPADWDAGENAYLGQIDGIHLLHCLTSSCQLHTQDLARVDQVGVADAVVPGNLLERDSIAGSNATQRVALLDRDGVAARPGAAATMRRARSRATGSAAAGRAAAGAAARTASGAASGAAAMLLVFDPATAPTMAPTMPLVLAWPVAWPPNLAPPKAPAAPPASAPIKPRSPS
ncbi:tat pathway signal sequence [Trichoderma cornu-damae]|uniref:Tat pathway signal sequence n=1 Tax=Trichoderma cornu-damae TaxID=654480 RepID=A0A9P8QIS5_9HYPO|nr:tat pathway signal sequence [Trichoderma cornu-damae]